MYGMNNTSRMLFVLMLLLSGCAKKSDEPPATKSLWSVWQSNTTSYSLNITAGSMGVSLPYTISSGGHVVCSCSIIVTGTEASGNYTLSSCAYNAGSGVADPGCAGLDGPGTFTHSGVALQVCDSGGCVSYH